MCFFLQQLETRVPVSPFKEAVEKGSQRAVGVVIAPVQVAPSCGQWNQAGSSDTEIMVSVVLSTIYLWGVYCLVGNQSFIGDLL